MKSASWNSELWIGGRTTARSEFVFQKKKVEKSIVRNRMRGMTVGRRACFHIDYMG
jgi:RNase P protein component